jgi:hypothetical protein
LRLYNVPLVENPADTTGNPVAADTTGNPVANAAIQICDALLRSTAINQVPEYSVLDCNTMTKQRLSFLIPLSVALIIFSMGALTGRFNLLAMMEDRRFGGAGIGDEQVQVVTTHGDVKILEGFWSGALNADLRIIYRINPQGHVFLYSLDQGGAPLQASETRFDEKNGELKVWFPTIGGTYRATLDKSSNRLTGTWKQQSSYPLEMERFDPSKEGKAVPREFRFLLQKAVSGDPKKLVQMAGFWSGYLDNNDDEDQVDFIVVQVENIAEDLVEPKLFMPNDLVEPKLFMPNESPLAYPVRNFELGPNGTCKIVVDGADVNAIFQGQLSEDGKKLTGSVYYDDQDETPPLELVWSERNPVPPIFE